MEDVTPPLLQAVREVRWRLLTGVSMKEAVRLYLAEAKTPLAQRLRDWWALKSQDLARQPHTKALLQSHYQRAFIGLIERGCAGQPTIAHLEILEEELNSAACAELEDHLQTLPFKILIPLLLFQFPAYLILLVGPLLRDLNVQLGG